VLSGIVVAAAVTIGAPLGVGDDRRFRVAAALKFLAIFVWLLLGSTWTVVVAVFAPRGRVAPGLFEVTLRTDSSLITTVVANAITLTPGTLTVDVKPGATNTLVVHALDASDVDHLRASVVQLEDLAVAAFPPRPSSAPDGEGA
jgi:multicomponent Na+:H+ antiporter subunit E